ncbi:TPA: hypothetical protein ACX6SA_000293 [Photobacterium damselae]
MINPFSAISLLYTVVKDAPNPINVQFEPPSPNQLPVELHEKAKTDGFYTSQLWIDNLSKNVLKDVRINLTAPLDYEPIVRTSKSHGAVEYKYLESTNELIVEKIDPGESLRSTFFLDSESCDLFKKPQIIVSDSELSSLMETMGFYKKYPSFFRSYLLSIFALVFSVLMGVGSLGLLGYVVLHDNEYLFPNSDAVLMKKASERMGGYGCPQSVAKVDEDLKFKVMSTFGYPETILIMNDVNSVEELWRKDKIAFIDCGKDI